MYTIAAVAKVQVRLQKQVKGKWKIFGQSFYPQFSLHKKRYWLKMSFLKMFLIFLCVAFEIFEFELLAIALYGNRTTMYGITSKVWSQLCPKLNMEISSNFHCCCNLLEPFELKYKNLAMAGSKVKRNFYNSMSKSYQLDLCLKFPNSFTLYVYNEKHNLKLYSYLTFIFSKTNLIVT